MSDIVAFPVWQDRSSPPPPRRPVRVATASLHVYPYRRYELSLHPEENGWGWWVVRPHDNMHCTGSAHDGVPYWSALWEAKESLDDYIAEMERLIQPC